MKKSTFEAVTFVQPGFERASGEWSDEDRKAIQMLRKFYPELNHWGDLAIGSAFGEFSREFLEVIWADWMLENRDEIFLDYCYWRQIKGPWILGMSESHLRGTWKRSLNHNR